MKTIKRDTYAGAICLREIYSVGDKVNPAGSKPPRPRFNSEEEREKHREAISRKKHLLAFHANFTPKSFYSTLTFDMDNECHTLRDCDALFNRYKRKLKKKYPDAVIFWYRGEGKNTDRFHIHMVTDGIAAADISKLWIYGDVKRIEHLRERNFYNGEDCGRDYSGLANYLFDHWRKEYGGQRWHQTKNAKKPEQEEPAIIKRSYSPEHPPRPPKGYKLVHTETNRFGYQCYKYVYWWEKKVFRYSPGAE